jgi:hypothetical protein
LKGLVLVPIALRAERSLGSGERLSTASARQGAEFGSGTDAAVESAARKANAHNFIGELSNGYMTPIEERGNDRDIDGLQGWKNEDRDI